MSDQGNNKKNQNQSSNPDDWDDWGSPKYNARKYGHSKPQGNSGNSDRQTFTEYEEHISTDNSFFGSKEFEAVEDETGIHKRTSINHARDGSGTFFDKPLGQVIDTCNICNKDGLPADHLRENIFVCETCNKRQCRRHSIPKTRIDSKENEITYYICTECASRNEKASLVVSCILAALAFWFLILFLNATTY